MTLDMAIELATEIEKENAGIPAFSSKKGKHFFKITGKELGNLRVTLGDLQISSKARSLLVWTERGADAPKFLGTQKYGNNITRQVYNLAALSGSTAHRLLGLRANHQL
ncbi:hypothetical protein [Herbaspirillum huttiense]|uniref:hypothetical protein n=1 Tax=Herbaspirillum huttiense TaxID=863372 RepID=UPI0039AFA80E